MNLYKVTYVNEFFDESVKRLMLEADTLSVLESRAERYAKGFGLESSGDRLKWKLLGSPTMGDRKLNRSIKKSLKISEKEFLLISD